MNGTSVRCTKQAHLPHRFEERQRLDVADRAADFNDRHVGTPVPGRLGAALDEVLDLVRHMGDHLDRLAQVLAAPFLADHRVVDLPGREVVHPTHPRRDETLIVAQVKVGLGAVFGDEDLAVLKRAHRPRVDIDVGIELDQGDFQTPRFEDRGEGGGRDSLSKGRHDATGDEHVFSHSRAYIAGRPKYTGSIAAV
jgi:hypothetical protein